MASIKLETCIVINACDKYRRDKDIRFQDDCNDIVVEYLYNMATAVNDSCYPYVIIDQDEFVLLRRYV